VELTALTDALVLAAPERYLRVLLDGGPAIAALLRELLVGRRLQHVSGGSVAPEFLARLSEPSSGTACPSCRPG
jgi:LuxR family transcriptional regulator, maltose regulon positive regulatory protein